jgi:phage-related protein
MPAPKLKPLVWIGGSKRDLLRLPAKVQDLFGFALYQAQVGERHPQAKVLKGFGSAGVLEVVEDWRGDTFRAVYTVRVGAAVYVLHCFQKKSVRGIATARVDIETIRLRLKGAEAHARGNAS